MRRYLWTVLSALGLDARRQANPFSAAADLTLAHLTVVLLLRLPILAGAALRFALHRTDYVDPAQWQAIVTTLTAFGAYITLLTLTRLVWRKFFISEFCQFSQKLRFCLVRIIHSIR